MVRIAHISDTHFGTEIPDVITALQQVMAGIAPDVIILSGDITQRARPSQFRAARIFMDSLKAGHKMIVPGNHDIPLNLPMRLFAPYYNYHKVFKARQGVWCNEEIAIIGYDATSRWQHTRGRLPSNMIVKGFANIAERRTTEMMIVVVAHQPLATKWLEDYHNILIDADESAHLLAENGADMVLSGHVHVPLSTTTREAFPTLKRHFVLAGAGTATSHRTRRNLQNSFYVIECESNASGKNIRITPYVYNLESKQFHTDETDHFTHHSGSWSKDSHIVCKEP